MFFPGLVNSPGKGSFFEIHANVMLMYVKQISLSLRFLLFLFLFHSLSATAKIVVLNGLTHIHNTGLGQVVTGKIQVKNVGLKPEKVLVYKRDLLQTCDGKNDFAVAGSQERSSAKWLETNIDEKLLKEGEEYEILYTIRIPQENVLNGSYWSMLMIEGADPVNEELQKGVSIGSKIRYAIQVITDIGTVENPKLSFENIFFKKTSPLIKTVNVKLRNPGTFMVRPKLLLEIYSKDGQKLKVLESTSQKVYPLSCKDYEIEIKDLPKGTYDAILVADYGADLFGTNLVIEIE